MAQAHGHGLIILHSNRMERLRELVVDWLAADPPAPLEDELFCVQSNGMAQWLKLALAEHHGISAANDFLLPARFLWQLYRTVLADEAVPRESPFDKAPLTWRLLRLVQSLPDAAVFAPLHQFLRDDDELTRHYQLAQRVADLFDQYQVYRADWLQAWAAGDDSVVDARGQRRGLDAEQRWQPALWRALIDDVPEPLRQSSRALLHGRAVGRLRGGELQPGLPRRLVVFGLSSLPAYVLEALDALASHAQVLLCVHNPCRYYWADAVAERELLRIERHRHPDKPGMGSPGDELYRFANPLLAAWGRQGRDYIGLLYQYDQRTESSAEVDLFEDVAPGDRAPTMLEQVQQAILDLDPVSDERERLAEPDDGSLAFHIAHSRQREVEVLHDRLLALLDADDDLLPGDVIVMVPDIETYAAHFDAVFGGVGPGDNRHIPYSIADRGARGVDPVLRALEQLLKLPQLRFSVSDVLDLLEVPALRERFGIAVDDLVVLRQWIEGANIRWGLNAEQRASFDLPAFEQNSFRFGIERMLLGYASADAGPWCGIEPYAEVAGLAAELAGRLARLLAVLERHWRQLATPAGPSVWAERIERLLGDCLAPVDSRDEYLLGRFREELDGWVASCTAAALESELPLAVVRNALLGGVEADSLSQRFLIGRLNIATLMPMRAIPFKVVCLLGMNDADYPRQRTAVDFDLMAQAGQYRPGDRSRRDDDHYLFLEALLSARRHLHISWLGRDIRDDSPRPPSVLVAELRDYIARRWVMPDGADPLAALTREHPLQPFSLRYFGNNPGLFTYAREWREVHDGVAADVAEVEALPHWLPEATLTLGTLRRFLRQPAEYFMAERLKVRFEDIDYSAEDAEPFAVDALAGWQLRSELTDELSRGDEDPALQLAAARERLTRRGDLPPGGAAAYGFARLAQPVEQVSASWQSLRELWPEPAPPQDINYTACGVADGADVAVADVLSGLFRRDGQLCRLHVEVGNLAPKGRMRHHKLLGPWIEQLAAAAVGLDLTTLVVAVDGTWRLQAPGQSDACAQLDDIVRAWYAGLQQPLAIACQSAFTWLQADDDRRFEAAQACYDGNGFVMGESMRSAVLARLWPAFGDALAQGIASWAPLLYQPLLAALVEEAS